MQYVYMYATHWRADKPLRNYKVFFLLSLRCRGCWWPRLRSSAHVMIFGDGVICVKATGLWLMYRTLWTV